MGRRVGDECGKNGKSCRGRDIERLRWERLAGNGREADDLEEGWVCVESNSKMQRV